MIVPARILALLRKEIAELARNRSALLPVAFVALITTALPFFIAVATPKLSGHPLSNDADLVHSLTRASGELPGIERLSEEAAVQAFIFSRFLVMTLLVPVTGAITFAGHSLIGEKIGRSLEPLLATPITTTELLLAKVAGAMLPSLAIMMFTTVIYMVGVAWLAEPGVLRTLLSPKTALLVFGLGPITSGLALQVGVLVSARVNDPRTAQQFGALFILPLTALFMAQMSGVFVLTVGHRAACVRRALCRLGAAPVSWREVVSTRSDPDPMEVARSPRPFFVGSVAVLGAGTMGAQIAAHFANAGVPALLLDLDEATARAGLERARKLRPDPFFAPDRVALVTVGGFDNDLGRIADADWVIEAIVEQLDAKRELLARVEAVRRPGAIVSSNTSGIPVHVLGEGRSDDFRRHWLGTHFFNPPRYLHLLEVIPTPDTDAAVVDAVRRFADLRLGKGVVVAKDTPNFIANHAALFGVLRMIEALESGGYTVAEIDAITGPALGRPKSATFRTMDIAGLDVLAQVLRNLHGRLPAEARGTFTVPALLDRMVGQGLIGEKAGAGFYKRVKAPGGESTILAIDPATLEYRPTSVALPSLDAARSIVDVGQRIRTLFEGKDRVGEFLRTTLAPTLVYTAQIAPRVAHSIDDVDWALKWGFGWELGPFETIDAIGIRKSSMPGQMLRPRGRRCRHFWTSR